MMSERSSSDLSNRIFAGFMGLAALTLFGAIAVMAHERLLAMFVVSSGADLVINMLLLATLLTLPAFGLVLLRGALQPRRSRHD